jgi:protein-L-isoaspartate(D-aspartate) O-methyltransferase
MVQKTMRSRIFAAAALIAVASTAIPAIASSDRWERQRHQLISEIEADVRATSREIGRRSLDARVLEAMKRVPRHEMVPPGERSRAYLNRPLPIGHGQTISQPYIVALMTDLLDVGSGDVVLEVGTGSGYQAAVLAELVDHVYTIEIVAPLARSAAQNLQRLGYDNITVRHGDGYYGWPDHAPFDAIIVTAAAGRIPPPLVRQLKPGGRMVVPVGQPFAVQQLMFVQKDERGRVTTRQILPVRFVPLTGER